MTLRVGLAQVDITPPIGSPRVGWCFPIAVERVLDPIFAKVCLLETKSAKLAIVSLDVLSVRWSLVCAVREIAERYGWQGANVMVTATHNHAGPAVASVGAVQSDDALIEMVLRAVDRAFDQATTNLQPATLSIGRGVEGRLAFCRRGVMTDGSTRCHPPVGPMFRHLESATDPSVGVITICSTSNHAVIGTLVNFSCHPCHYGGDPIITAGWPGQLSIQLARHFGPQCITLLLNGAFADAYHHNYIDPDHHDTMERFGEILGNTVKQIIDTAMTEMTPAFSAANTVVNLPRRDPDGPYGIDQPHPQHFIIAESYPVMYEKLRAKRTTQPDAQAEIQCITLGEQCRMVGIPAELFTELGLAIKSSASEPWVMGAANGMVGYVPTARAFDGGGYECTLATSSKLEPNAGDRLVVAARALLATQD